MCVREGKAGERELLAMLQPSLTLSSFSLMSRFLMMIMMERREEWGRKLAQQLAAAASGRSRFFACSTAQDRQTACCCTTAAVGVCASERRCVPSSLVRRLSLSSFFRSLFSLTHADLGRDRMLSLSLSLCCSSDCITAAISSSPALSLSSLLSSLSMIKSGMFSIY